MKTISFFVALLLSAEMGCSQTSLAPGAEAMKKLSWLEGAWTRTNPKPGRTGQEIWTRLSGSEWKGLGITLHGSDTAFVEKLKLTVRDGHICYVADLAENREPVYFRFTEITGQGFVCENPEHDFPKKISYQLEGKVLKATISGNGRSVDYFFERK